jgi:PTS system galactitol-specific IIA component
MIEKDLIRTGLELNTSDQVIELLAGLLFSGGYVNDDFKNAVIEREKHFPTGLSTGENGFAIPHTDPCYVKQSAVAIGILNKPIKFGEMGDSEHSVDVDIVILLAIQKPDQVVTFLKDICTLLQDKTLVARLHTCGSPEEVEDILKNRLLV